MANISAEYDVVVIGGGPAGSTTSTILAQGGLKVGLFEREKFPRFHIGESLIPETYWVLKRLNMLGKMQTSHFVKKYSVQFINASGKLSAPFYFWDNKPHECSQTWQVVRSEFDQMMLENAREHGVDAHDGVHVVEVLFDGDRRSRLAERGQAIGVASSRRPAQGNQGPRRRRCERPGGVADESHEAAPVGSNPQQGRDLDLLGRRVSRHRQRRGRDDGDPDAGQGRLVLEHSPARQHRLVGRRGAVRLPVQGSQGQSRADVSGRGRAHAGDPGTHQECDARHRLLRDA
jgi:hypothetical protein